jgi:hypothetical protein
MEDLVRHLDRALENNFQLSVPELSGEELARLLAAVSVVLVLAFHKKAGKQWGPLALQLFNALVRGVGQKLWGGVKPTVPVWANSQAAVKWIRTWASNLLTRGHLRNSTSPGRPRKVAPAAVKEALACVEAQARAGQPFHTWSEACDHPTIAAILTKYKASAATLYRNMRHADPHFCKNQSNHPGGWRLPAKGVSVMPAWCSAGRDRLVSGEQSRAKGRRGQRVAMVWGLGRDRLGCGVGQLTCGATYEALACMPGLSVWAQNRRIPSALRCEVR